MQQIVNDRVRTVLRVIRPRSGAVANARDAVENDERAAGLRRDAALEQAASQGPRSWQALHRSPVPARRGAGHAVHFASSHADLVGRLASYVADGLAKGEVCLVIATAEHRAGLRQWLAVNGLEQEGRGELIELDADELLQELLLDGSPDPAVFDLIVGNLFPEDARSRGGIRAFGEMVGLLSARGDLTAALELERLWESTQKRLGFPLLCAYVDLGDSPDVAQFMGRVCAVHTHLAVS
jgi:hypothetical protein